MRYLYKYVLVAFAVFFCVFNCANAGFTTTKIGNQPIWNATYTDKLRQDLLLNYDKFSRPTPHYNTTTVKFGLAITHLELNEFKSQLTVYTWTRMMWTDEKLKWDPDDYGGLSVVRLADHEIWQPDIYIYNSPTPSAVGHYANTHFLVYSTGEVLWVPPCQYTVLCDLNLRYWPFDEQECYMKFASWTYSGDVVDLDFVHNSTDEVELELMVESTEWEIVKRSIHKNTIVYFCCPEPYVDMTVNVTLARRSPSYKAVIVTPAFVILMLILTAFWLPPNAGEKIIFHGCISIIICMFLFYFTQKLPAMGSHTPLIVMFYSNCLFLVSLAIVESVATIWLSRTKHTSPVPWVIKKVLTGALGKWLGLTVYIQQSTLTHRMTAEEMRDHHVTDLDDQNSTDEHLFRSPSKPSIQQDWILLAAAIDRLSFCFYTIITLIMAVAYSL